MTVDFGRTSIGTLVQSPGMKIIGDFDMTPVKGKPLSISAYLTFKTGLSSAPFTYEYALYTYAGDGNPASYVAETAPEKLTIPPGMKISEWRTLNILPGNVFLKPRTNYFICIWAGAILIGSSLEISYETAPATHGFMKSVPYTGNWPASITGETPQSRYYSIYCTMTQDTRPGFGYNVWTP